MASTTETNKVGGMAGVIKYTTSLQELVAAGPPEVVQVTPNRDIRLPLKVSHPFSKKFKKKHNNNVFYCVFSLATIVRSSRRSVATIV